VTSSHRARLTSYHVRGSSRTNYRANENHSSEPLRGYPFSQPFLEKINAKQKLFFNSKSGEKVIPSFCLHSKQKSRKNNFVIKQKSHKRSHFESIRVQQTLQHQNSNRKTGQKQFYFSILIKLIFGYFVLFIKNLY
jgi:hypothetical protein